MAVIDSRDNLINAANSRGPYTVCYFDRITTSTTAANTTSGYVSAKMMENLIVVPTMTSPSTECYLTYARIIHNVVTASILIGKIVNLGNINISTGTFTAGSSMPTSDIAGASTVMGSPMVVAVVTAALTATTPLITATYTDQAGNTGQSCAITLPTNAAVRSAFYMNPHLASADSGVRAITACTKSAGSAGTLTFYGVTPLSWANYNASSGMFNWEPSLAVGKPLVPLYAGDTLGVLVFGTTGSSDVLAALSLTPN